MTPNRVTAETYTNSQISQEGIKMTGRNRNVAFRMLLVGLASLMLMFVGSASTTLAGGGPTPPPGFTTVLVTGQATLCTDGKPAQGAKVILFSKKNPDLKIETTTNSEGKFSATAILFGTKVEAALADLGVKFPGFDIGQMTSFVLRTFFGTSISINACLHQLCQDASNELTWEVDPAAEPKDRTWPKLTWEDFQGEVPEDAKGFLAESAVYVVFCWACKEGKFTYQVKAIFDRSESWALDDVKNNPDTGENQRLLRHEKGHFNLGEVYARKLRKALSELKDPCKNPEETGKKIKELAEENSEALNDEQKRYDNETQHGTDKDKQEEWEKKIQKDLDDLKDYSR